MNQNINLLRIWHTFAPEKLQNIDGIKGSDICPLPNTKDLPYKDILIRDSKIAPEIFIYSGKGLSQIQKQQYEDLHQEAKRKGGRLYVIDGDEYLNEEMIIKIPNKILKRIKGIAQNPHKDDYLDCYLQNIEINKEIKANFIDFQRAIYLNHLTKIDCIIREKYGYPLKFDAVLYTDFDIDPIKHLHCITEEKVQKTSLPVKLINTHHSTKASCSLLIKTDCNAILHSKNKIFLDPEKEPGLIFSSVVNKFYNAIEDKILKDLPGISIRFPNQSKHPLLDGSYTTLKMQDNSLNAILQCDSRHIEKIKSIIGTLAIGPFEGCKDLTWTKSVEDTILQSSNLNSTKIFDADVTQSVTNTSRSHG